MTFWDDDDVRFQKRASMMVRKDILGFANDGNLDLAAQYIFAIVIVAHDLVSARLRNNFNKPRLAGKLVF